MRVAFHESSYLKEGGATRSPLGSPRIPRARAGSAKTAITHACYCYKSRCRTVGEPWIVKRESLAFTVCQRLVERSVRLGAAANVRGGGVDETISATMGARRREWCSSGGPGPAAAAAR